MSAGDRSSWWSSFAARSTLVFLLLLIAASFGSAWLVDRAARTQVLANAKDDLDHAVDLAEQRIGSFVTVLDEDIAFLAANDPLNRYTAALDSGDTVRRAVAEQELAALMRSFIRSRPFHTQVRYIGADSAGMEIIRFNMVQGLVEQVPDSLLQAKGKRDFYRATMALPGDQHYFSALDLNQEHGVIERPFVPTLRSAAGIDRPSGIRAGIVVINADLRPLFRELHAMQPAHAELMLADERGQLLLHPDSAKCFHEVLGRSGGLGIELAAAEAEPYHWMTVRRDVHYPQLPGVLTLALRQDLRPLLAELDAQRNRFLAWAAAVAFLLSLFWAVYARTLAKGLGRITQRVERYAAGERGEQLPLERRDEIGRLARSISNMQVRIDQRVADLEHARQQAEDSDRLRRDLVANMSHEVRTPLNAIIGMAGEVDVERMDEADRQRLAVVRRSAQRLKGLVDDLLLNARAGEGRLTLSPVPTDVRTVVMDIAHAYRPAAVEKHLALRAAIAELPQAVLIDPLRLHQVVDNLVGNAVRFTREGQVDIAVTQDGNTLSISVSDTGPGIAPEHQARVFERFERAASSEAADGAGLGLAITRRLVEAMGGRIALHSEVGKGSRFNVELPAPVAVAFTPASASPAAPLSFSGLRVLYVEDVESNRMLMEQWAGKWGWDLVLAENSEQALAAAEQGAYGLVLIDLDLGDDMRGTELLFRLRGLKRFRYVPMLVVTAFADEEHEAEVLKAGANDRITKPIDAALLQASVAFWTGLDGGCADVVRTDDLARQYDGDPEKVLRAFQQFRKEFTAARIGFQAARAQGDADKLSEIRHRIRPHWMLLGQFAGVRALDELNATQTEGWSVVEDTFRCCDRALMLAQQALLTGAPDA